MKISTAFSMPSRWTFSMPPVRDLLDRYTRGASLIIDPFCGQSDIANMRNDLAFGGVGAVEWCNSLICDYELKADVVLFDPPYSPRQISECYKGLGLKATMKDTQNARLYSEARKPLSKLLKPGGLAISFGWQSSGFGGKWPTLEILLVQHGGAHNDTICVVQSKPL